MVPAVNSIERTGRLIIATKIRGKDILSNMRFLATSSGELSMSLTVSSSIRASQCEIAARVTLARTSQYVRTALFANGSEYAHIPHE